MSKTMLCRLLTDRQTDTQMKVNTAIFFLQTIIKDRSYSFQCQCHPQDPALVPLPGGTVYVHKKACRFTRNEKSVNPGLHRHVRRFMLSRQPEIWGNKGRTPAATDITY